MLSNLLRWLVTAFLAFAPFYASGCGEGKADAAPPPPVVSVARPLQREVIEWDEYTGHLEAPESVDVVARVSGFVEETPFEEGAVVRKDDLLYVIDARPFKADLDSKLADVAKAQSQEELAEVHLKRFDKVHNTRAISEEDYDTAKAELSQAQSAVAAAKAAAEVSRLNLEWTRVVAPIGGRISRKYITKGNLINGGTGQVTLLTTIQSLDPIYCYVDVDERSILRYQRLAREKKRVSARDAKIPTFLQLENETYFPHEGVVDFVDNKVDPGTGTLRARGVFPNPDRSLTPGFFGRVRVPGSGRYQALLVPDSAIGTDQDLRFLLTVGPDSTVQLKPVTLGALFGKLRCIDAGIGPNDRVIVNGLQSARPGSKVDPQEVRIPADSLVLTAPGSPTTQALPETRPASTQPERPAVSEATR
ncbi:MAG TPA: efflux RND transporter periplasmic adaptor subunit [Tepidisphaeraceae bacterium]|jgi:RND family efflux transporter MFP subunit